MNSSRPWGDWMVEMDEDRSQRIVRMTDAEWKDCAKQAIIDNRGRGDLRIVLTWMDEMDAQRAAFKTKTAGPRVVRDLSPTAVTFRVWRDMILEPAKYGDADWEEWLVMDQQLRTGSGRWRVGAFWLDLEEEQRAQLREVYAARIQAAWRGHRVRDTQPGLTCEDCLARTIAPLRWNGQSLCAACLEHRFDQFTDFVEPAVLPRVRCPRPRTEPNEHGDVPCDGCGAVCVPLEDYGEYRPGWWCSRTCAYDL